MEFRVQGTEFEFEIPDEWWEESGIESFKRIGEHYHTNIPECTAIVPVEEVEPPLREDDKFWFRNKASVVEVLTKIATGEPLDSIEVWSKERREVHDMLLGMAFTAFTPVSRLGIPEYQSRSMTLT